jgi:hypothetical protein
MRVAGVQGAQQFHLLQMDASVSVALAVGDYIVTHQRVGELRDTHGAGGGLAGIRQHEGRVVEVFEGVIEDVAAIDLAQADRLRTV